MAMTPYLYTVAGPHCRLLEHPLWMTVVEEEEPLKYRELVYAPHTASDGTLYRARLMRKKNDGASSG
jgi:hypothetical protein